MDPTAEDAAIIAAAVDAYLRMRSEGVAAAPPAGSGWIRSARREALR
jgi:hypothetical protein